MPYVKTIKSEKITLPSDPHYFIMWRPKARYGEMKQATSKAVTVDTRGNGEADFNPTAYTEYAVLAHIESWNLDDAEGKPLPLEAESLNMLEEDDMNLLLSKLSASNEKQQEERKK